MQQIAQRWAFVLSLLLFALVGGLSSCADPPRRKNRTAEARESRRRQAEQTQRNAEAGVLEDSTRNAGLDSVREGEDKAQNATQGEEKTSRAKPNGDARKRHERPRHARSEQKVSSPKNQKAKNRLPRKKKSREATPTSPPTDEMKSVAKRLKPSVFKIASQNSRGEARTGVGFYINDSGMGMCSYTSFQDCDLRGAKVQLYNGKYVSIRKVVHIDEENNVIIFQTTERNTLCINAPTYNTTHSKQEYHYHEAQANRGKTARSRKRA